MSKADRIFGAEQPVGAFPATPRQTEPLTPPSHPSATAAQTPRTQGSDHAGKSLLHQFHSVEPQYRRSLFRR